VCKLCTYVVCVWVSRVYVHVVHMLFVCVYGCVLRPDVYVYVVHICCACVCMSCVRV